MRKFLAKYSGLLLIIIPLVLFVPFTFERFPECKFLIVNEKNEPLAGVKVVQVFEDSTFDTDSISYANSDENGYVVFPKRTVWGTTAYRIVRPLIAQLLTLAHQSTGLGVRIHVDDPDYYATNSVVWNDKIGSEKPLSGHLSAMRKDTTDIK